MCHAHARPCLSTGWALNRRFGLTAGTAAVLAQGGGGYLGRLLAEAAHDSAIHKFETPHVLYDPVIARPLLTVAGPAHPNLKLGK